MKSILALTCGLLIGSTAIANPHPTLGETIGMAAEVAHGTCTDVPAPRKK